MNMTVLMGYLGTDPYKIEVPGSKSFGASFKIATNERLKLNGELVNRTDWHKVNVWGKSAEYCINSLKKGSKVLVQGAIRNNDYLDKEGIKHYSYEVYAKNISFISRSKKAGNDIPDGTGELENDLV